MFVTGCHRSGTSLVASVLAALLPEDRPEQALLAPALDNPGGFHESAALVRANEALLGSLGAAWDHPPLLPVNWCDPEVWPVVVEQRPLFRQYALQRAWVDKDPRLAITAPAFQHILLRRPGLVVVLREPLAVARSLRAREGWPLEQGLCLWWIYNLHLAAQMEVGDLLLCYEQVLDSLPGPESRQLLRQFLELHAGLVVDEASLTKSLSSQCHPEWSRSGDFDLGNDAQLSAGRAELLELCRDCFSSVESSTPDSSIKLYKKLFSCIPAEVLATLSGSGWQGWSSDHLSPKDRLLQQQLTEIYRSKAWRLTAPVRWISGRLLRK